MNTFDQALPFTEPIRDRDYEVNEVVGGWVAFTEDTAVHGGSEIEVEERLKDLMVMGEQE